MECADAQEAISTKVSLPAFLASAYQTGKCVLHLTSDKRPPRIVRSSGHPELRFLGGPYGKPTSGPSPETEEDGKSGLGGEGEAPHVGGFQSYTSCPGHRLAVLVYPETPETRDTRLTAWTNHSTRSLLKGLVGTHLLVVTASCFTAWGGRRTQST
jgi:hypothetical protein